MKQAVLYLSYDGILEPLGQSQVIRYLERLSRGQSIVLLSFVKPKNCTEQKRRAALLENIRFAVMRWIAFRFHKRLSPLATAYCAPPGILVVPGPYRLLSSASSGREPGSRPSPLALKPPFEQLT